MQPALIGPTYNLESRPASVQRTVNMVPVPLEPGNERAGFVFRDVPGLVLAVDDWPVGDPFFDDVLLLMHFDGNLIDVKGNLMAADGTSFADPGRFAQSVNMGGTAVIGGGSNVVYMVTPSAEFWLDGGDFTIEGWCKNNATDNSRPRTLVRLSYAGNFSDYLALGISEAADTWQFQYRNTAGSVVTYTQGSATPGQWFHLAMTREGDTLRFFVNGALLSSAVSTHRIAAQAVSCHIGNSRRSFIDALHGEIDDVRITKGVARYTAAFTAPTQPFPDF